jgi:hypothetical protein
MRKPQHWPSTRPARPDDRTANLTHRPTSKVSSPIAEPIETFGALFRQAAVSPIACIRYPFGRISCIMTFPAHDGLRPSPYRSAHYFSSQLPNARIGLAIADSRQAHVTIRSNYRHRPAQSVLDAVIPEQILFLRGTVNVRREKLPIRPLCPDDVSFAVNRQKPRCIDGFGCLANATLPRPHDARSTTAQISVASLSASDAASALPAIARRTVVTEINFIMSTYPTV